MLKLIAVLASMMFLVLGGARNAIASPAKPSTSEYLVTEGAGFLMHQGEGVIYAMTFAVRKNLAQTLYATVVYENPSNSKAPFVVGGSIAPGQKEFLSESPGIPAIKNQRAYRVEVYLFSDEARTHQVGYHAQLVFFQIPKGMEAMYDIKLL